MAPGLITSPDALPTKLILHIWAYLPRSSTPAIAGVNKRWRALTITSPAMWTYIRVSHSTPLGWLWTVFGRAQTCTVAVDVRFQLMNKSEEAEHEFDEKVERMSVLMEAVAQYVDRIRGFGIRVSEPEEYEWDSEPMAGCDKRRSEVRGAITGPLWNLCAPRLEQLHINVFGKIDYLVFRGGMPRLTHLYLGMDTDPRWVDWQESKYLWAFLCDAGDQLTHLYVGDVSDYLDGLLQRGRIPCPQLRTLTWAPPWASGSKDATTLRHVISVRNARGAPIEKVRVSRYVFRQMERESLALLLEKMEIELFSAEEKRRKTRLAWM